MSDNDSSILLPGNNLDPLKVVLISCCAGICNIFISLMPFSGVVLLVYDNIPIIEDHVKVLLSILLLIQIFFILFECGCICQQMAEAYLCVKSAQFLFYGLLVIISIFFAIFGKIHANWKFFVGNALVIVGMILSCCSCICVHGLKMVTEDETDERFPQPIMQFIQINQYPNQQTSGEQEHDNNVIIEEVDEEAENRPLPAIEDVQANHENDLTA